MNRYWIGLLTFFLLGVGCQSNTSSSVGDINDFAGRWTRLAKHGEAAPLKKLFSHSASAQADQLLNSIQAATKKGIDINLDADKVCIAKQSPQEYEISIPFALSGNIPLLRYGKIQLFVQEDVFGSFTVTGVSENLSIYVAAVNSKKEIADHRVTSISRIFPRDTMVARAAAVQQRLANPQDQVIFYTQVDSRLLFYVARGHWDYSALYDHAAEKDYQLGIVDEQGNEVVPVAFDKLYNPGGTLPTLIEVERDGKRGFYNLDGEPIISASFEAVYPYQQDKDVLAQVRIEGRYGWIDRQGVLHMDRESHPDQSLFTSPLTSDRLLGWHYEIRSPGLSHLRVPDQTNEYGLFGAIIVSPSYLYDLGLVDEYHANLLVEEDDLQGAGAEEIQVAVVSLASFSQRLRGLVATFVEWGADARDYHAESDRLITLDEDLTAVATLDFNGEYQYHLPNPERPFQETALFETREVKYTPYAPYDEMTCYSYYQIGSEGGITPLSTHRLFSFTKFIKIGEENFRGLFMKRVIPPADRPSHRGYYVRTHHLTLEDLDVMRNEIFAEYGYRFQSEKWRTYFSQQPWYHPQYDNVDAMLSDIDRYNVAFIYEFQQKMRGHEQEYIKRDSVLYMAAG